MGGGVLAYFGNMGASYIPAGAWWQTAAFLSGGAVLGLTAAKWASMSLGTGMIGGVTALGIGRVREAIALSKAAESTPALPAATEAKGLFMDDAGKVYQYRGGQMVEAGKVVLDAGALSMAAPGYGKSFRRPVESGAVVDVPGPIRRMGPASWIHNHNLEEISAHNA